jgi:hypothetical protein
LSGIQLFPGPDTKHNSPHWSRLDQVWECFSSQVYSLEVKVESLGWYLDPLYKAVKAMSYAANLRKLSLINGDSEFLDRLGIGVVGTCAYVL